MPVPDETRRGLLEKEAMVFDEYLALKRAGQITDIKITLGQLLKRLPIESHEKVRRAIRMAGFLCDVVSEPPAGSGGGDPQPQIVDAPKPSTGS